MRRYLIFLVAVVLLIFAGRVYGNTPIAAFDSGKPFRSGNYVDALFGDTLAFEMCEVMPGPEVASLSPFPKPLKKTTSTKEGLEGFTGCHYDFETDKDAGYPQIDLEIADNKTAANTLAEYKNHVDTFKADWRTDPVFISDLGDAAAFLGTDTIWCDICNLYVVSGRYLFDVKFKGYSENQITANQKQESGVKLVNTLFQKKPFLRNKK